MASKATPAQKRKVASTAYRAERSGKAPADALRSYDQLLHAQHEQPRAKRGPGSVAKRRMSKNAMTSGLTNPDPPGWREWAEKWSAKPGESEWEAAFRCSQEFMRAQRERRALAFLEPAQPATHRVILTRPPDTTSRYIALATNAKDKDERERALRRLADHLRDGRLLSEEQHLELANMLDAVAAGRYAKRDVKRGRPTNEQRDARIRMVFEGLQDTFYWYSRADIIRCLMHGMAEHGLFSPDPPDLEGIAPRRRVRLTEKSIERIVGSVPSKKKRGNA